METARFVMIALGTFLSVLSLSFTVFRYWRKKQDEKFDAFKLALEKTVAEEGENRRDALASLRDRVKSLESWRILQGKEVEGRLGRIEGELKGIRGTLDRIQQWFIENAGGSKK